MVTEKSCNLSRLKPAEFDDDPRFQEKQEVKNGHTCWSVFVACLTIPRSK